MLLNLGEKVISFSRGSVNLTLPEKVLEKLRKRAGSEGKALEELLSEAIFNY